MRKFNLSLDDYSPRPGTDNIEWCFRLIDEYPNIKIDLFVPSAYARLGDKMPYYLSDYPDWVKMVKDLPNNFGICLHGMYHRRKTTGPTKYHDSNNDEWEHLTYLEAKDRFSMMLKEFDKVGLRYRKVFRPPGWRISRDAAKVLTESGFIIAGDTKYYNILKDRVPGMRWISYNWDIIGKPKKDSTVVTVGHSSNWTVNYINESNFCRLVNFIDAFDPTFIHIDEVDCAKEA